MNIKGKNMPIRTMGTGELFSLLLSVPADVELSPNDVGNLMIFDKDGNYIGFVDFKNKKLELLKDEEVERKDTI